MRIKLGLHNHTCLSDGYFTPSGLLIALKEAGYDVVAITDHNVYTVPHPLQLKEVEDLLVLRGCEVTFPQMHIVVLEPIRTRTVADILLTARVGWIAHPYYQFRRDTEKMLEVCKRYNLHGAEIYNAGDLVFDKVVAEDWPLNFYAGDDVHVPSQINTSWMEMDVESKDKDTIIEKLIEGDYDYFRKPSHLFPPYDVW